MLYRKSLTLLSIGILSGVSLTAYANIINDEHMVIAPKCLIQQPSENFKTIANKGTFVLLKTNENGIEELISRKTALRATCGGFMDVTADWQAARPRALSTTKKANSLLETYTKANNENDDPNKTAYKVQFEAETNKLIQNLNPQNMWNDLTTLSSFPDRYYQSDDGVKAAEWIKAQVETIAKDTGHTDVTVYTVPTGRYKQPSVVAKIGNGTEPGIVLGGHMDTLSSKSGDLPSPDKLGTKKPGADDDGTGTVTILEVARVLLNSGMQFKKPIYVIWYAAEEVGLVGSSYVVKDFKSKNIPVDAVLQLDMTGYAYKNERTLWLMNDHVNKELTNYLKTLVETYVKQEVSFTRCGYACSDHASWHQAGFKASFPFESEMGHDNPDIHTSRDTMEKLSLDHITDYAKLAIAFAVELAEPVKDEPGNSIH